MAENPYTNKVQKADGTVIMDISSDTVTPSDVLNGVTFHDRSGASQQGSLITHNVYDGLDSTSTSDALSANQGKVLNSNLTPVNKNISPATGYHWNNTTFTKVGRFCFLSINGAQGPANSGWTTVATVPSDCKPYALAYSIIHDDATQESKEMRITTDGELQIWGVIQSHLHWGEIIWVSNA